MLKLNAEDQELFNKLKDKYSSQSADPNNYDESKYEQLALATTGRPQASTAKAPGGKQSDAEVKMCPLCQGAGFQVEEYNHRRLEKFCNSCQGKGVNVYRNGIEVLDPAPETSSSGMDGHPGSSKPAWAQNVQERINKLEADISTIDQKLASYTKERAALVSTPGGGGSEGEKLRQDLATQLDLQISRLTRIRQNKAEHLVRYQTPATVDDLATDDQE